MSIYSIEIHKMNLSDDEEGQFNNLVLNLFGGLKWENLTDEEKQLCIKKWLQS